MNKMKLTIIIMLFTSCVAAVYGQVTIGSNIPSNNGALLDLKQEKKDDGSANSSKGLLLPRVILTNPTDITTGDITGVTPANKDAHIGLTVYNIGNCPGVYVWTGSEWIKLGEPCIISQRPDAPLGTNGFFCLPSGSVELTASVNAGETVDWYAAASGGSPLTNGTGTLKFPTGTISSKTIYYAEARNTTTGAVSTARTAVVATFYDDESLIATTATPAETSGLNIWGDKVVVHAAKPGVYDSFISADFGAAGRWMTTNLAAWAYDAGVASPPTLTLGVDNSTDPRWCYPGISDTDWNDPTKLYNDNKHLGLLYNWPAATGNQNLSMQNQSQGTPDDNTSTPVQGICPNGWHVPSDKEWTDLENEIIRNTTEYADVSSNIDPGDNSKLVSYDEDDRRFGNTTTHGAAMKSTCLVAGQSQVGNSRPPFQNGFSVPLVGTAGSGAILTIGNTASLWSSSNVDFAGATAWRRGVVNLTNRVSRVDVGKDLLSTVRCVKN
ncbi:FISUMP domain-containing protein [Dysgonomonas sp.]